MESLEYKQLVESIEVTLGNKDYKRTVSKVKEKKENGKLDYVFGRYVKPKFKKILTNFIDLIENPELKKKPNYRKILLYSNNDFIKLFKKYGYELGSWLTRENELTPENNRSFFNFPLFFSESCRKCAITKYSTYSIEELDQILGECIDLKHCKSKEPRKDRDTIEDEIDVLMHPLSPEKNRYNTDAEEYSYNGLKGNHGQVARVTKKIGTGFGFDLLSLEGEDEVLVSVKASDNMEGFLLSKAEHDTMVKSEDLSNTEYYIYKYLFEKDSSKVKLFTVYKYDKENDVLVDVQDESNICNIEYKETTGKHGLPKRYYACNPVKPKLNLNRDKRFILKNNND